MPPMTARDSTMSEAGPGMNRSRSSGDGSRRLGALGVFLLAGLALWVWGLAPRFAAMPPDFRYGAQVFSRDNFYDEDRREFRGEEVSRTGFSYSVVSRDGDALRIENVFDVRTITGDKIFTVKREYGVDARSGRHLAGRGDRDRDGYLFAPRWVGTKPFTYWHINYDEPARLAFQGKETLFGLTVHRFACDLKADQTKDLRFLPGVGKTRGVGLDVHLELWIEPVSGALVKYEDKTLAYYYDLKTKERLHPWNRFRNTYAEASVAERAAVAGAQRLKVLLLDVVIPALLLVGASLALMLWADFKFELGYVQAVKDRAERGAARLKHPYLLPASLSVLVWMFFLLFAKVLSSRESAQIENALTAEADRIASRMAAAMEPRIQALGRLASAWESTAGHDRPGWTAAAGETLQSLPGYQALEWVDTTNRVRWIVPLKGNESAAGLDLGREERRRQALQAARESRKAVVTRTVDLKQGGKGFIVYQPVFPGKRFGGYILAVFRYDKLLNALLEPAAAEGHTVVVSDGSQEIFRRGEGRDVDRGWSSELEVPIRNLSWRVKIRPDPAWSPLLRSQLPRAILILGGLLSVLMGFLVYLTSKARAQAHMLSVRTGELMKKNEEVEAFVYLVSHDLRAPLVNIQGFAKELAASCRQLVELAGGTASPQQPAVAEIVTKDIPDALRFITASTDTFQRLIDAMLRLSRAGSQNYRSEELDMVVLVDATLDSMRRSIDDKGARITVSALPPALGDATALSQVFANLISNALKYLQPGRPGLIAIGGEKRADKSRYWVRDNGSGIPATAQKRLFQVFQRFHPDLAPGEGIGLATVRRIVERHGGDIWVDSAEGAGTTVYFTLRAPSRQP